MATTTQTKDKRKGYTFVSIRVKLLVLIVALITIVLGLAFALLYATFTGIVKEGLRADLEDVLNVTAPQIDGDAVWGLYEDYIDAVLTGDQPWPTGMTEDERFLEIADLFEQVRAHNPRAYPYIYVSPEPGAIVFVIDSLTLEDPDSKFGAWFGEYEENLPDYDIYIEGLYKRSFELVPSRDAETGKIWVYGIEPIKDTSGYTIGALAVEIAASDVVEDQVRIRTLLLPTCAVAYALVFVAVLVISNSITAPIRLLSNASNRIGEGEYNPIQAKPGLLRDEVWALTQTFNIMVDKVREREEKLKQQVEELKIMIDPDKLRRQVNEITESDFFQDLQSQAQRMRGQKDKEDNSET